MQARAGQSTKAKSSSEGARVSQGTRARNSHDGRAQGATGRQPELEEARANTRAVIGLMQALNSAHSVEEAITKALDAVRAEFGWAYGSYWALDRNANALRFHSESGTVNEDFRRVTLDANFREGVGLSGRAWKSRDLYFTPDIGEMTDCCRAPVARAAGVKSGLCFPILNHGAVTGTMDFFALETLEISDERREVLRQAGSLISAALERIQQEEVRAEAAQNTQAVNEVLEAVAKAGTPEEVAKSALDTVKHAFGWAYGSYWKIDPAEHVLKFNVESGSVNEEFRRVTAEAQFREGEGLSGRAWKTRDLYFTKDIGEMADCCRAPVAKRAGVKSGVCFPILVQNAVLGTMDFFALETLDLSKERIEALRKVGSLVSAAMERVESARREREGAQNTQAVNQVLEAVGKAGTPEEVAKSALDTVKQAFGWAYGSYWKIDPAEQVLKFNVESGTVNEDFRRVTADAKFREGEGLSGRAWKNRDLYFTKDIGEMADCCRAPVAKRAGVKSGVCFPILVQGSVVGTMDFFALETLSLSGERMDALRKVGSLVSTAMERVEVARREKEMNARLKIAFNTVGQKAQALASASEQLTAVSQEMGKSATETSSQATVVSAASEQVSRNVAMVATSAEEMNASIREI